MSAFTKSLASGVSRAGRHATLCPCEGGGFHYGLRNMKKLFLLLCLAVGVVVSALAASGKFAAISHEELQAAIASKSVTVLDANGTDSFKEARIPGAIDFEGNEKKLANLLP